MKQNELVLKEYQKLARDFLRGVDKAGLFLDMGLGKTATTLSALEERHLPALVVAPKRVAESVWNVENDLWTPGLTLSRAVGSPAERAKSLASGADVVVLSRDNQGDLERAQEVRRLLRKPPFRTVVIDESSGYKSHSSVRFKTLRKFLRQNRTPHVWELTGTPSPNGLMDLWSQIALLDDGERLGRNITTFRNRYFYPGRRLPNNIVTEWHLRPEAEDNIKAKIQDICLYMSAKDKLDLPDLNFNIIKIDMPPRAKQAYREMNSQLVTDLRDIIGGEVHTAASAGVLTSKLAQISSGFLYVDDAHLRNREHQILHTKKIEALREIIESATSPILLFYRFDVDRQMVMNAFPQARHIGEKIRGSEDIISQWTRGAVPILVCHPLSAGHGLNLQYGGHTEVWYSLTWSEEEWDQGIGRLYRQNQTHPVVVHILEAAPIDRAMLATVKDKQAVQAALNESLESPI